MTEERSNPPLYLMRNGNYSARSGMVASSAQAIRLAAGQIAPELRNQGFEVVHVWHSPLQRATATAGFLERELEYVQGFRALSLEEPRLNYEVDLSGVLYTIQLIARCTLSSIPRPAVIVTHGPSLETYARETGEQVPVNFGEMLRIRGR